MKKILLSLIAAASMTSCAFYPYLTYSVELANVETSVYAKRSMGRQESLNLM